MRVLLIIPRFQLPIETRTTPQLGIAYLAALSEQHGDEVRVYDQDIEDISLEDVVREYQPDVVGITSNTPQVKQGWLAARQVKSVLPNVVVVQGGPHVSALPEESAARPEIDIVVRGEGEMTWLERNADRRTNPDLVQPNAKSVIVLGEVTGNVTASEKVDIRDNGSVDGDIVSPRVAIAEGAHFRGSVDMQRAGGGSKQAAPVRSESKPAPAQPQQQGQQKVGV